MAFSEQIRKYLDTDERTHRARMNSLAMFIIRGISILVSLLYVPLLLKTLNTSHYGVWLIITSIMAWINLMDIGLGNGLRNKLVEAIARQDITAARMYISSAYAAMITFVCILIILFLTIGNFISWDIILNAHDFEGRELMLLVNIVFISFCVQFILNLQNSILFSFQKPALSSLISMLCNLFAFIAVIIAVKFFGISTLLTLGIIISVVPICVLLISTIYLFSAKYKAYRPSLSFVRINRIKDILNLGIKFFVIQIITIVLYQTNNILITHIVDANAVVQYNIPYKYMNILAMAYTIIITPIWSATTDAFIRNDMEWIRKTGRTLLRICCIMIAGGVVMLLISPFVFDLWLGTDHLHIPMTTTGLVLLYVSFKMAYSNYGYIINGTGKIQAQLVITSIVAILYIPAAYFLGTHLGLNGIILASAIVNLINFIWSRIQYRKIITNSATGIWNK